VYRVLVEKHRGETSMGRPSSRRKDNNKVDLQEVGCGVIDWIKLAEDRDR
jgi:hypothetical protein